tara:strand:- start:94 stop:519 length:426 start_codon:yes stop_codon:yes gene_type:complete
MMLPRSFHSAHKTIFEMHVSRRNCMDILYGVYNADGGLLGELAYVWGKIRGTAHCALCDITHRGVSKKKQWKEYESRLRVPIKLLHINEQEEGLAQLTEGKTPCVVGGSSGEFEIVMFAEDLEECGKSVEKFESFISKIIS